MKIKTILLTAAVAITSQFASAIEVTSHIDSNSPGTLRHALATAPSGDTITFAPGLSGKSIQLYDEIYISDDVTIDASGLPDGITIDANSNERCLHIAAGGHDVWLYGMTLTGGNSSGIGGCIFNDGGILQIYECAVVSNTANGDGGAVFSSGGRVVAVNCTFARNQADDGGAIFVNNAGTLRIVHCTIANNLASNRGGGIYMETGGSSMILTNSIVADNRNGLGGVTNIFQNGSTIDVLASIIDDLADTTLVPGGEVLVINAFLQRLGDYGGPTVSMAPFAASPAIKAATGVGIEATEDQRGVARWVNNTADIGSIEFDPNSPFTPLPSIPTSGLVALYRFDETSGTTAADSVTFDGAQNGAQVSGSIHWTPGLIGGSLDLDGNSSLEAPDPIASGAEEFSISAWVKPRTVDGYKGIYSTRVPNNAHPILNWGLNVEPAPGGTFRGDLRVAIDDLSGASFGLKTLDIPFATLSSPWHHLVLTWKSDGTTATAEAYVDGELAQILTTGDDSGVTISTFYDSWGFYKIGNDDCCGNRQFDGRIDDLSVWNRALRSEHISDIYANGRFGVGVGDVPATGALYLDGVDDWMEFSNANGLIPDGDEPFTIEAWINPSGGGNGHITFWGEQSGNRANGFRLLGSNGGRHYFWSNDFDQPFSLVTNIFDNTAGLNIDGWHHMAITFANGESTWYLDGEELGSKTRGAGVNVSDANHRLGSRLGVDFFHGFMDEVRIWDHARSPQEIRNDFGFKVAPDAPGLVAYWPFNGSGQDSTGNGHDGTMMSGAAVSSYYNAPVIDLAPLAITGVTPPDPVSRAMTVTWDSHPAGVYNFEVSSDLSIWGAIERDADPGTQSSVTFFLNEGVEQAFFRIRQINPFWR